MGFCSEFICSGFGEFHEWFVDKWQKTVHFGDGGSLPISSKLSAKADGFWASLVEDIQHTYSWGDQKRPLEMIYLHECGGITYVEISQEEVCYYDVQAWRKTDGGSIQHYWGDDCLDTIQKAEETSAETEQLNN